MKNKFPDEIDLDEINPVMLAWMQHSWNEDYADEWKLLENNSYLTASFMNPEGVQAALGKGNEVITTSDEEFEQTSNMLKEYSEQLEVEKAKLNKRRKRRKING